MGYYKAMEGIGYIIGKFFSVALAHTTELPAAPVEATVFEQPLDALIANYSVEAVYLAAIILGFLLFVAMIIRNPSELAKKIIFWLITAVIAITTGALVGMTIYLNQVSVTGGPVHWHADFEIWACGTEQDLLDPTGISNKIGTPTLHEHNDKRIHVEGVVVEYADVNLGAFFRALGGEMTNKTLTIPTNTGMVNFLNGQDCNDTAAQLQVFVIEANLQDQSYSQQKITDLPSFRFAEESAVPPGDCIIIEFDQPKDRTDHLCQSYEVALATGELTKEVPHSHEGEDGH